MKKFKVIGAGVAAVVLAACFFAVILSVRLEVPVQLEVQEPSGLKLVDQCPRQVPVLQEQGNGLPEQFKVTSWNIYKLQRPHAMSEITKTASQSDLVIFQEATDEPAFQMGLLQHQLQWQQVSAFRFNGRTAGVMTAARQPSLYNCVVRTPEPFFRLPKSVLISLYSLTGSSYPLLVINVHAVNFEPGVAAYRKQLLPLFKLIKRYPGPVVLAGDFNSWGNKRDYMLRDWSNRFGLREAVPTPDERRRFLGTALDHVFYRGLELVISASPKSTASDHNPVYAEFRTVSIKK